jgi:hypothetical protein
MFITYQGPRNSGGTEAIVTGGICVSTTDALVDSNDEQISIVEKHMVGKVLPSSSPFL